MQIKNIIFSGLFAGATLAAPVAAADSNIEKRAGKCNAHIYVDGHWDGTNPDGTIKVPSGNGMDLWISGKPARKTTDQEGALKMEYNSTSWMSNTCEYLFKGAGPSNGMRLQFDWWCSYDC
ncbi:hypothetical protein MBLNU13_g07637t1 [Cladosporium sp. NU13]